MINNQEIIQDWIENYDFNQLSEGQKALVIETLDESEYSMMRAMHMTALEVDTTPNNALHFEDRKNRILHDFQKQKTSHKRGVLVWQATKAVWPVLTGIAAGLAIFFLLQNTPDTLPVKPVFVKHDTVYIKSKTLNRVNSKGTDALVQTAPLKPKLITTVPIPKNADITHVKKSVTTNGTEMVTTYTENKNIGPAETGISVAENEWARKFHFVKL